MGKQGMSFNFRHELGKLTPRIAQGAKVFIFGASPHWDFICKRFKYLVNVNVDDYVDGFIDNDPNKQGTMFHGKLVRTIEEIDLDNAVIIIATFNGRSNTDIAEQLDKAGMIYPHSFFLTHCFMTLLMRYEYERFLQFKGKHKGQRCFIIGTGPSLMASDLERIKNEVSFATNKIYSIFKETSWRPSYYVIHDDILLRKLHDSLKEHISCPIFYAHNAVMDIDEFSLNEDYYYNLDGIIDWKPGAAAVPIFSEEPPLLHWGATVTYDCLQLAVYMGFNEIFLLGVDNTSPMGIKNNGEIILRNTEGHFSSDYGNTMHKTRIDISNAAYQAAEDYTRQHGIKIFNATRGGELEVFKRVCFDELY